LETSDNRLSGEALLMVKEFAAVTGLSPKLLYRLIRTRKIPFTKIGGRNYFYMPAIHRWLLDNTIMPGPHVSDWRRKRYDAVELVVNKLTEGNKG
jgi:excisionase family DNA binding protein